MSQARAHHGIDPFEVVRAGNGDAARLLKLEAEPFEIHSERSGQVERDIDLLIPIARATDQVQGRVPAGRHALPARDLVGDAGLDDGGFVVDLNLAPDVQGRSVEAPKRTFLDLEMAGDAEVHPDQIGEEGKPPPARLEEAHPGKERVALLDDLKEVLVDVGGVTARGDIAIDIDHPAIGREVELPS